MRQSDEQNQPILDVVLSDLCDAQELNRAFSSAWKSSAREAKLFGTFLTTPLGAMLAVADDNALRMLEFFDRRALVGEINKLSRRAKSVIAPGNTAPIAMLENELAEYFLGNLKTFRTPVEQHGTPFQLAAWSALLEIPYGETRSYQEQACFVGKPLAHRAVANANGCNQIAVVIPCHRIIKHDGSIGGYGGKPYRKQWLLDLESKAVS